MRTGFTTGACAQGGVRACVDALLTGRWEPSVQVKLPNGKITRFTLHSFRFDPINPTEATVSIIKDGGDDPDCTHGAEIVTTVRLTSDGAIRFSSGPGVGTMTKPGLAIPVGEPAINPVPREFMSREFRESLGRIREKYHWDNPGIMITVSVPDGEERSKKTLNARLGIVGGLSILGTKGIVVPFSTAAYRASITQAIEVACAQDIKTVVMTTGGQSEAFAAKIHPELPPESFIQIGDFTGYSIRQAAKIGIEHVILAGFLGKFSKLAKGVTQTHAAGSQVDLDFLVGLARETGASEEVCEKIRTANTARHVGEIIEESGNRDFFGLLCENIICHIGKIKPRPQIIEVLLTNFKGEQVGYARKQE